MTSFRRAAGLAAAACVVVLAAAPPAAADAPRPTRFRSVVDSVTPIGADGTALRVSIVGGDSFLRVEALPGHEVVVYGYESAGAVPYLRFLPDGRVEENQQSTAAYVNDSFQQFEEPVGLDPSRPEFVVIDDDGEHAWHDHRIHYMAPGIPPGKAPGDEVFEWRVPIEVDGVAGSITGRLQLLADENPLPWVAGGVLVAAALIGAGWFLGWTGRGLLLAAGATTLSAAVAVVVGRAELSIAPEGSGASNLVVVVPGVALVTGAAAVVALASRRRAVGAIAVLASVAALLGWAGLRAAVLFRPVLPTSLSPSVDRSGTVLALAAGVAAATIAIRSGALAPPPLPAEDG